MNADDSDGALVRAARHGDKSAFAMLLQRHCPVLLALCTRMLRDRSLAEDMAQEASLRAFLSLDRLHHAERFGAWLSGIGLNLSRHYLNEQGQNHWSLDAVVGGRHVPEPIDQRTDPVERAEEAELAAQVRRAVDGLPRGQRAAVLLFYLSGLTHTEIAAALGVDVGAVKQRLHKARLTLRRRLAPTWRDERMETEGNAQLVEMRIADVRRIPPEGDRTLQYIVVLEEVGGERRLPIWVGRFEGESLAQELEKVQMPRPPTYTFTATLLQAAGGQLREVIVSKLADNVFYAEAIVSAGRSGKTRVVDARPSDVLNLALLTGAPVRVRVEVLEAAEKPVENAPCPNPALYGEGTSGAKEIAAEIAQSKPLGPTQPR